MAGVKPYWVTRRFFSSRTNCLFLNWRLLNLMVRIFKIKGSQIFFYHFEPLTSNPLSTDDTRRFKKKFLLAIQIRVFNMPSLNFAERYKFQNRLPRMQPGAGQSSTKTRTVRLPCKQGDIVKEFTGKLFTVLIFSVHCDLERPGTHFICEQWQENMPKKHLWGAHENAHTNKRKTPTCEQAFLLGRDTMFWWQKYNTKRQGILQSKTTTNISCFN